MRTRTLALVALLALPVVASAQVRPPRGGRQAGPLDPAPLPPAAPGVARVLAYQRSRWSTEGYTLISSIQAPTAGGGVASYTSIGSGTHADYRYTDRLSATADITVSGLGGPIAETAEVGARFRPMPWNEEIRPFVDLRAAYMHMYDSFAVPQGAIVSGSSQQFAETGRYSHGVGSIAGAGFEYGLTNSLAVMNEVTAMRSRMTAYRTTGSSAIPSGSTYWMTSFRYVVGIRYNPVRSMHLVQKPAG